MKPQKFITVIGEVLAHVKGLIEEKNTGNYASPDDALHNFRAAADDQGVTMGQALRGLAVKHQVVVNDMCSGAVEITEKRIDEHALDLVVYAAIRVAVLYEMMEEQNAEREVAPEVVDNQCDDCSERGKGYYDAIAVVQTEARHLGNAGHSPLAATYRAVAEHLRKER